MNGKFAVTMLDEHRSTLPLAPDVVELDRKAKTLTITTTETKLAAADLLDACRTKRKGLESARREAIEPLNQELKRIKEPFDFAIKLLEENERLIQRAMADYDRKAEEEARKEQERLNRQIEAQNQKRLEKADAKGEIPVLKAPAIVEAPTKTLATSSGNQIQGRKITKWRLKGLQPGEDIEKLPANDPRLVGIPLAFLRLDIVRINKAVAAGIPVADCIEIYQDYEYVQRGRK